MSVLLTILKIIGLTLLYILAFLLVIVLLVLLWPVTYKAEADFDKPNIAAKAKVRWFIASVPITFIENKLIIKVKVLGIKVFSIGEKEKKPKEKKKDKKNVSDVTSEQVSEETKEYDPRSFNVVEIDKSKETSSSLKADAEANTSSNKKQEEIKLDDELKAIEKETREEGKQAASNQLNSQSLDEEGQAEDKEEVKKSLKEKLKEKFDGLVLKVKGLIDKLSQVLKEADNEKTEVETFFRRRTTKKSLELIKKTLFKLIKHIIPRKITGQLELGLADPATTGYVTAGLSVFYTFTEDDFDFTPVFDEEKIVGHVKLRGHIFLGYIVLLGVNAIIRKSFRMFIKNALALKDSALNRVDTIKSIFVEGN